MSQETRNFVLIQDVDPSIVLDLRYATENNFTKKKIYPLAVGVARVETARKLAEANAEFQKRGYRIKVWDAYRPPSVQKIFWDLVPDDRYVANPYKGGSRHNRGGAVDITLVDQEGHEMEMPTGFDDFSSRAWPNNFALNTKIRKNLTFLRKVMMAHGFTPIEHEWWHFDDSQWKTFPLEDVAFDNFVNSSSVLNNIPDRSSQVLVVEAAQEPVFKARITAWQRKDNNWEKVFKSMDAVVGRNGLAEIGQKKEGDGKTPTGNFDLGDVFGYDPAIDTKMKYTQVTDDDIWVDDPHSAAYNQWKHSKDITDAKSFERMKRSDDLYRDAIVIEYNTHPIVTGAGSAIFLHIWRNADKPTAGCVALSGKDILRVLKWLDASANPIIVIRSQP